MTITPAVRRSILAFLMLVPACGGGELTPSGADAPAARCAMAFDPGPCRGAIPVYAFDGTACVSRTYGGCDGNDNRFTTLEECWATCEGRPVPNGCPPGRVAREICLSCGVVGGCGSSQTVCAQPCDPDAGAAACGAELPFCAAGVCQMSGCI